MTSNRASRLPGAVLCAVLAGALAATCPPAGAHGPGEQPAASGVTGGPAAGVARAEAASESFELVVELGDGALTIYLDRYETNEPVGSAQIEVASGTVKAVAAFRAERGDYVVKDPAMLKALAAPGEHGLVFTVVTPQESDLLTATWRVGATAAGVSHDHDHDAEARAHDRRAWIGAGVLVLGLAAAIAWWRRRRRGALPRGGL